MSILFFKRLHACFLPLCPAMVVEGGERVSVPSYGANKVQAPLRVLCEELVVLRDLDREAVGVGGVLAALGRLAHPWVLVSPIRAMS